MQLSTRKIEPIKKTVEVNYGPPQADTGLPFPTSVKGWFTTPAGKKTPAEDVTFTEYRRYTPRPDEVDIEKQFGVTLPPLPSPRPPLPPEGEFLPDPKATGPSAVAARPRWPTWWLYAGAGVLAVLAAAVVVYARRRRAAA